MANPRKTVAYDEIGTLNVTMKYDNSITYDKTQPGGSAAAGRAVSLAGSTSDDIVTLADDGAVVHGKLISVDGDGFCVVQVDGYCTLPGGNGATLTLGTKIVGALNASSAKGFVKTLAETVSGSPSQAEVQNAFKAAKTKGIIINNNDTTAVVVEL